MRPVRLFLHLLLRFNHHLARNPGRDHDHACPLSPRRGASAGDDLHVFGPPHALKRQNHVIATQRLLADEFQGAGDGMQRWLHRQTLGYWSRRGRRS